MFLQGYYMPSIFKEFKQTKERHRDPVMYTTARGDRLATEEQCRESRNNVVEPQGDGPRKFTAMMCSLRKGGHHPFIHGTNHYEGCAPKTIQRIIQLFEPSGGIFVQCAHPVLEHIQLDLTKHSHPSDCKLSSTGRTVIDATTHFLHARQRLPTPRRALLLRSICDPTAP